jgi:hypothetical protein
MWPGATLASELRQSIRSLQVYCNPFLVPKWKREEIGMDFVIGLPRTQKGTILSGL